MTSLVLSETYVLALLQSHSLFFCKTIEAVRRLIGEGAKVGDRRGDDATPLMIQVSY